MGDCLGGQGDNSANLKVFFNDSRDKKRNLTSYKFNLVLYYVERLDPPNADSPVFCTFVSRCCQWLPAAGTSGLKS